MGAALRQHGGALSFQALSFLSSASPLPSTITSAERSSQPLFSVSVSMGKTFPSPGPFQASPRTSRGHGEKVPPSPLNARRRTVLLCGTSPPGGTRCAEMAGKTAADCAAVCCCCPCGLLGLMVLVMVKLPAGLCRRSFLQRHQMEKKRKMSTYRGSTSGGGLLEGEGVKGAAGGGEQPGENSPSAEVSKMEKEMWAQFTAGGFWRSPSQRTT